MGILCNVCCRLEFGQLLLSHFSCVRLCDPIDSSPPGSPVPGILQGKNTGVGCHFLLQCMKVESESEVAQSCIRDQTFVPCIARQILNHWITREILSISLNK